jgi:hypothetical protein
MFSRIYVTISSFASACAILWFTIIPAFAHDKDKVTCLVDVVFGDDADGISTDYILRLQHKNNSRRTIEKVSVLVMDAGQNVFRSAETICGEPNIGIEAGDTGECRQTLQHLSGRMANTLGYDAWVRMVDDQKAQLTTARFCEIEGVNYAE